MRNSTVTALVFLALPSLVFAQRGGQGEALNPKTKRIEGWAGYGGDSVTKVIWDPSVRRKVFRTTFSDASSVAWAHRGIRVKFDKKRSIARNEFNYIHFDYKIDRPAKAIGYFLQDEEGNMWRAFTGPVIVGRWARSVVKESQFKFGWGKKPPGNRKARVVGIYLFVETPKVNSGARFNLRIHSVTLNKKAPPRLRQGLRTSKPLAARQKYLLLDSRVTKTVQNARLAVGTVKKHSANPLFGQTLPWETSIHHMYPNVLFDKKDQLYKIWYFTMISGPPGQKDWSKHIRAGPTAPKEKRKGNCATLYAVSRDGIKWNKPALDIYRYKGKPTNIVVWGTHGTGVFKDQTELNPRRRYKRIAGRHPHGTLDAAFSADGVHWSKRFSVANARGDTHNNALWVPELRKYVAFSRAYPPPGIRTVLRMESKDFVRWSRPVEVMRGPIEAQTYSMPVFRYADLYLGLVAVFHTSGKLHGRVTTELAWSPDTKAWFRVAEGQPILPLSTKRGDINWGCVYAAASPIVQRDQIRIYYSGQKKPHGWNRGWLCLATLRPDGWAGYVPRNVNQSAIIETQPILVDGAKLWVTADIRRGGSIEVSVLNSANKTIAKGSTLTTSSTEAAVTEVPSQQGRRVRIRFELRNSQLYSFGFNNASKR